METVDQSNSVVGNTVRVGPPEGSPPAWISGAHRVISRGTASPVLVTDEHWRVVALNPEAERLLGFDSQEANGRPCNTLLYGRDRFGNRLPQEQCDVGSMARRGELVHPFELDIVSATGEIVRAACSVIVLADGRHCRVVHILTPIPRANETLPSQTNVAGDQVAAATRNRNDAQRYGLTTREVEVLRLLAEGNDCHAISKRLFISLATVRNHVHNFFRKLNVHSQIEAVAMAYRERLI